MVYVFLEPPALGTICGCLMVINWICHNLRNQVSSRVAARLSSVAAASTGGRVVRSYIRAALARYLRELRPRRCAALVSSTQHGWLQSADNALAGMLLQLPGGACSFGVAQ